MIEGETTAYSISNTVESTEPVCYIQESSTYFTSIEGALTVANANAANNTAQTVVVIPNVDSSDAGTPLTWITKDCQIGVSEGADVRLVLTADTSQTEAPSYTSGSTATSFGDSSYAHCDVSASSAFADSSTTNVNKNLKSNIGIANGVKVTIENTGQLDIGGTVGTSSQRPTGHVRGEYCQVTMKDKASIVSNGGDINLYGYIKEESKDNGSSVTMNSGTFLEPLVFYDFYGGTHTTVATGKASAFPLNTYDLPSCQVLSRFYSSSTLTGVGGAYADSKYYMFTANLISNSSSLFVLSDGYLDIKYTAETIGLTSLPSTKGYKTTTLTSYSNCKLDSLTMSLAGTSLKSSSYHFPIPYTFDIVIASGKLEVPNKVKFLLGSNLIINSGATVEITQEVVFYQTTAGFSYAYKAGTGGTSKVSAHATCINNGTLTINSAFAGIVDTTEAGATLTTGSSFKNSVTLKETTAFSGSSSSYTYTTTTVTAYAGLYYGTDRTCYSMSSSSSFTSALNSDSKGYWSGSETSTKYTEEESSSTEGSGGICILPDTPILMADNTCKRAIDVRPGDLVWAFNHETGKFEKTVIILNPHLTEGTAMQDVLRITMESGRKIGIVNEHGFFCVEENKYVYVNAHNYTEFIGKHFISVDPETKELIKDRVIDITYNQENTKTCSPVSKMSLDVVTADMISIPGGIRGWFNFFEFSKDELMKYDEEKMKADIEKYGLATADDFASDTPERAFEIMPLKYFTISVGKGHATWAKLLDDLAVYGPEIYEGMKNY